LHKPIPSRLKILAISEVTHVDSTISDDDFGEKVGIWGRGEGRGALLDREKYALTGS
jgi:hypothetical protein